MTGPILCTTPGTTELVSTETTNESKGRILDLASSLAPMRPTSSALVNTAYTVFSKELFIIFSKAAIIAAHPAKSSKALM